ncbi:MAG: hypothetical protein FRX49_05328 [Trebouxia sp. A1-2]|nr:MAG: hypothetical protein FRX49_05328 [Trebouxia sp. A1-2]
MAASVNLAKKTFVITGGNSGIGLETARALLRKCTSSKSRERGDAAVQELKQEASPEAKVECMQIDLASFSSIRQFAEEFEKRDLPLHVLVNNAGVFIPPNDRTEEDFEVTLGINHFGPFYLTHLLLHNLEQNAPARIVNLGSVLETTGRSDWRDVLQGKHGKDDRSGLGIYGTTKLFNIMLAKEYSRRLQGKGIDCLATHPGLADTPLYPKLDKSKPEAAAVNLFEKVFHQSSEDGAISTLRASTDPSLTGQGFKYFGPWYKGPLQMHVGNEKERTPSNAIADDMQACKDLYDMTLEIVSQKAPDIKKLAMPEPSSS